MKPFLILLLVAWSAVTAVAGNVQTSFSLERAERTLRDLSVGIGPRPMGSPGEASALAYARDAFLAAGCDTAYIMPMMATARANTSSGIAVGIRRGATGRIIVIGGHIDSAGPEIPGADDDASGSAVVMEVARVHAQANLQSTIVYCCFGGEEEGLEGSRYFVDNFPLLDSVALMLQADMANGLGVIDMDPETHGAMAPSWLVRAAIEEFDALGYSGLRYPTHFFSMNYAMPEGSGSDHESFLAKGIPAIDFTTDPGRPIHTPQDNFDNFDVRGLKRTGDLVVRLAERFDAGVPSRTTEQYWLYLAGSIPLVVPVWGLWCFTLVALVVAAAALVRLRAKRIAKGEPGYAGWSSPKVWFLGLVVIAAGWMTSDLVGVLRGVRHPWMTQIGLYAILGLFGSCAMAWLLHRSVRWRITASPYPPFRTSVIVLVLMVVLSGLVSVKLLVAPAMALFLMGLAMLVRPGFLRAGLLLLSPVWLLRLVFSEWDALLFRTIAYGLPTSLWATALVDLLVCVALSILLFPFFLGVVTLVRDSAWFDRLATALRAIWAGAAPLGALVALGVYLMTQPVYDRFWSRDVRIEETYSPDTGQRGVSVKSSEFLAGAVISHGGRDTSIAGRTTTVEFTPAAFDTSWARLERSFETSQDSAGTTYNGVLRIACTMRPLTVSVRYTSGSGAMGPVSSVWEVRSSRGAQVIQWKSFQDSVLVIPVRFTAAKGDSVRETMEVVFNRLADPLEVRHDLAYVIPRTKVTSTRVYR